MASRCRRGRVDPAVNTEIVRSAELPSYRGPRRRHAAGVVLAMTKAAAVDGRCGRSDGSTASVQLELELACHRAVGDVPVALIVHSSAPDFVAEYVPEPPSIENVVLARVEPMGCVPVESCWVSTDSALLRPDSAVLSARATSRSRPPSSLVRGHERRDRDGRDRERPHDEEREQERDTPLVAEPGYRSSPGRWGDVLSLAAVTRRGAPSQMAQISAHRDRRAGRVLRSRESRALAADALQVAASLRDDSNVDHAALAGRLP